MLVEYVLGLYELESQTECKSEIDVDRSAFKSGFSRGPGMLEERAE